MGPDQLTWAVFLLTLSSGLIILASLVVSIFWPQQRIWPPPKRESWQFYLTWITYSVNISGGILLGMLDWNSGGLKHWLRFPTGLLLIVAGLGLALWGVRTLGWHRSSGLKDSLIREGPYQFTRNPQYVGDSLALLGYAILVNSELVWVVNSLGVICFLLTPFTEEPWLKEHYGKAYEDYKEQVPRYL